MERKKLKRTVSGILVSSVLAVTALAPQVSAETVGGSLDNFKMGTAKEFSDVVSTDWYYSNVADAAALGIIQGNPDGTFNPNGNLSVAEALTLASRVNAIFFNRTEDLNSDSKSNVHWADGILNYAEKNGIVSEGYSDNLDNVCTRVQMADMFAKSVPTDNFTEINSMDLAPSQTVSEAIATLFKAGVLVGDSSGFRENDSVTRAESAAIINRVVMPAQRVTVTEKIAESDNADASYSGPFCLNVCLTNNMLMYPEDWDATITAKGPNGEDSVKITSDLFSEKYGWYQLKFNIGAFAVGDSISISATSNDSSLSFKSADFSELKPIEIIMQECGYLGEDAWVSDMRMIGTEDVRPSIWMIKDYNGEASVVLTKTDGTPFSNAEIRVTDFQGLIDEVHTTDSQGVIKLKVENYKGAVKIYTTDKRYAFYKGTDKTEEYEVVSPLRVAGRFNFKITEVK